MTSAVGIIGSTTPAPASAGSVVSAQTDAPAQAAASTPAASSAGPAISPRIVIDPLAGPITQFLGGRGEVESQIPSTVAVAYLRAGLQANGQVKGHQESGAGTVA